MPDTSDFPIEGFVRLSQILKPGGPIPVSKSTWWQGVKEGRFPQPQKLGPRIPVSGRRLSKCLPKNTLPFLPVHVVFIAFPSMRLTA